MEGSGRFWNVLWCSSTGSSFGASRQLGTTIRPPQVTMRDGPGSTMVEVYAQVVSRTDHKGNAQVVPYIVLSHSGVTSHTVLTDVGV